MNRRSFLRNVGVGLGCLALSPRIARCSEIKTTSKLAMIIWDGCERTRVKQLMRDGYLPNLSMLASQGSIVELHAGARTCTKPGHAAILTGYGPYTTGVWENTMWTQIPHGLSILERLYENFGSTFNEFWTSGKSEQVGAGPGKVFSNAIRYCLRYDNDDDREMDRTGTRAVKWINNHKASPGFWFIHFREPDFSGHHYGEGSAEYSEAIINLDSWLGEIVNVAPADMAIMVLTDHGFDIGGFHKLNQKGELRYAHFHAPKAWIACNRPLARCGNLLDVAPTVYEIYGIDYSQFFPPLLGSSLLHEEGIWNVNEEPCVGYSI